MDKQSTVERVSSIRTYAHDLERVRSATGHATKTPKPPKKTAPKEVSNPVVKRKKNHSTPEPRNTPPKKIPTIVVEEKEEQEIKAPKKVELGRGMPAKDNREKENLSDIPPFHTLSKSSQQQTELERGSELKKDTGVSVIKPARFSVDDNEDSASATIITDNKKSRHNFFKEVWQSITDFFKNRKKRSTPKYTVPEATRRKGVIQDATSKTARVLTADSASIKERIKKRQQTIKPRGPETFWSPNTEPGYPLLEDADDNIPLPRVSNVVVEPRTNYTKERVPVPTVEEVTSTPETNILSMPVEEVTPSAPTREVVTPAPYIKESSKQRAGETSGLEAKKASLSPITVESTETEVPNSNEQVVTQSQEEVPTPELQRQTTKAQAEPALASAGDYVEEAQTYPDEVSGFETQTPVEESLRQPIVQMPQDRDTALIPQGYIQTSYTANSNQIPVNVMFDNAVSSIKENKSDFDNMTFNDFLRTRNTNVLTIIILGAVLTMFFVYIASQILIGRMFDSDVVTERQGLEDALSLPDNEIPLIRYNSGAATTDLGTILLEQEQASSEIILIDTNSGRQLSGREIFSAYSINLEPSLTSSIGVVTVGMLDGGLPAIIMKVNDFESSKGGLLSFERTMVFDVYRMFGQSIDSNSPLLKEKFVDAQIGEVDVRVMRDENETIRLIWGFVDENTVIISPTGSAFERYIDLVK